LSSSIAYEQPLNERVRTFLRVEYLFDLADHYSAGDSPWDARLCLASLLEIVDLIGRSDVRNELIKELERHSATLTALEANPGVDPQRLASVLRELNAYLLELRDGASQPGQVLRKDELVQSIRQRNAIPGGTCNFDLPAYHHWLHNPATDRKRRLDLWQKDLQVLKNAMKLALNMIRNSTSPKREQAERGFFQKPIESNVSCQLVRVVLPAGSKYYPEISGGRHRFTVRFMEQPETAERPAQTQDTVEFILHCCIL